ncbi:MAG: SH3 domain-containing protein [Alphaproteobacteria bacterium]|nr:SH3 domain-containing protein [Rickettsiales bacterium]
MLLNIFSIQKCLATNITGQTPLGNNADNNKAIYASIKAKEANVRKGPGTNYPIFFKVIGKNTPVKVYGKSNEWALIQTRESSKGWIKANFLSSQNRYGTSLTERKICRLPTVKINLCQIIGILPKNSNFKLIQCGKKWCRIEVSQKLRGWIVKETIWGINNNEIIK